MFAFWMEGDLNSFEPPARECFNIGQRFTLQDQTFMARYFLGLLHYVRNELNEAEQYLADVTAGPYAGRPIWLKVHFYWHSSIRHGAATKKPAKSSSPSSLTPLKPTTWQPWPQPMPCKWNWP
jgi:hypothetical protein